MLAETVRTYLTDEPVALFITLVVIVAVIHAISDVKKLQRAFDILPSIFWIYFVPMLLSTLGFLPAKSPVYGFVRDYILPTSLFLLFLSVSIPELLKLGRRTLLVMLAATATVIIGAFVAVLVILPMFKGGILPEHHRSSIWKGIAALSGSWTGGSANMAAIWESLTGSNKTEAEKEIYSAMLAVDVCVGYAWMALLIALAAYQKKINGWLKADNSRIEEVNQRMQERVEGQTKSISTASYLYMLGLSLLVAFICLKAGAFFYGKVEASIQSTLWKSIFGAYAITIVLVTLTGLFCSATPVAKLETYGASKIGYALLAIVLARIGAEGNLNVIKQFPGYLGMGVVWIFAHGLILLLVAKLLKAPLFFAVTASQANIGGPVSAPVVAAAHQPNLAVVGLLMAIAGNVLGTFAGLFVVAPVTYWLVKTLS